MLRRHIDSNDTIQQIAHEEGRTRIKLLAPANGFTAFNIKFANEFFVKDRLGKQHFDRLHSHLFIFYHHYTHAFLHDALWNLLIGEVLLLDITWSAKFKT